MRRYLVSLAAMTFAVLGLTCGPALAERRVALVIGNAAYRGVPALKNPEHDADAVSQTLRKLDFEVMTLTNLDKRGMETALHRFAAMIDHADVALFYFSGHALQADDQNYLVPTTADVTSPAALTLDMVALQDVSGMMRAAGAKVELLILDACRNNPFPQGLASGTRLGATRGLAPVESALGSLVVFATSPGEIAYDGEGDNSPFTDAFLRYAAVPNLEIRQVLSRVRAEVAKKTQDRQTPWDNSSLVEDFYLVPRRPAPQFDHVTTVAVAKDPEPQPLHLVKPLQPEGGTVTIELKQPPKYGHLLLDGRELGQGDTFDASRYDRLTYRSDLPDMPADAFSVGIADSWGNKDFGFVSIARSGAAQPLALPQMSSLGSMRANAVSLVGLGPNLVFKPALDVAKERAGTRIQLASALPFGQLVLGDRVIEQGRSLVLSDVPRLAFLAPSDSIGHSAQAIFKPEGANGGELKLDVEVAATDCDRLAGARLDPQGVTEGVVTGQIEVKAALAACEAAVEARPDLARFHYEFGRVLAAAGRNDEALSHFKRAADLGYVRALQTLGEHDCRAVPADFVSCRQRLEQVMAKGDVFATHALGMLYYEGRGVKTDIAKARGLFEAAARVGHTYSMNSLGGMYERGEGMAADPALARRYWEESAMRGDIYGLYDLGFVYLNGIAADKDSRKALDYFTRAADAGHPDAPNAIGRIHVLGLGVPVDYGEGRHWYRLGSERGDAWASYNLAELNRLGRGGPIDLSAAAYYDALAASSVNELEPAGLGKQALLALARPPKIAALRQLMRDNGIKPLTDTDEALIAAARQIPAVRRQSGDHADLDDLLLALGQIDWSRRVKRTDLF